MYLLSHRHAAPVSARIEPPWENTSRLESKAAGLLVLLALFAGTLATILLWRIIALAGYSIQLFQVFDTVVVGASALLLVFNFRLLVARDWIIAANLGAVLGFLVPSTGFYALFEWATGASHGSNPAGPAWAVVALAHGGALFVVTLAGLCIMRRGGPVTLRLAAGEGKKAIVGLGFGVLVGLPLAIVNGFANMLVQGRPFILQSSVFPLVEALEPGFVEELVYRFALLGILWTVLRPFWGARTVWIAGVLAILIHSYAHYGNLLITQPLSYLAFAAILALVWGVPMTVLALRRELESAIGFHWVQDAVRFMGGL